MQCHFVLEDCRLGFDKSCGCKTGTEEIIKWNIWQYLKYLIRSHWFRLLPRQQVDLVREFQSKMEKFGKHFQRMICEAAIQSAFLPLPCTHVEDAIIAHSIRFSENTNLSTFLFSKEYNSDRSATEFTFCTNTRGYIRNNLFKG